MRRFPLPARGFGIVLTVVGGLLAAGIVNSPSALAATTVPYSSTPLASWRTDGQGYATAIIGGTVYIGGDFTHVTNPSGSQTVAKGGLAAFDLATGALITSFTANTNGTVESMATDGTRLFVGGAFSTVNGVSRRDIAEVNPTTGAVTSWNTPATGSVYAMRIGGGRLYVGGAFLGLSNASRSRLGALSLADGSLTTWAPVASDTVLSLAVSADGTAIYAGGAFTNVNGAGTTQKIARLNNSGAVVATNWRNVNNNAVIALDLSPDQTHLAMGLANAGNQGGYWSVVTGARLFGQFCDGDGQAVLIQGDFLYSGFHDGCNNNQNIKLTANSISGNGTWDQSFLPVMPAFFGTRALAATNDFLVDAGQITSVNGVRLGGFAIFPAIVIPPDNTPPSAPGTLSASGTTATATTLSWGAATDNQSVAGYRVIRNGVTLPGIVTGRSTTDAGLTPSTTYQYAVVAVDGAGNVGPPSNQISVTTADATGVRYSDAFSGADGSSWAPAWTSNATAGSVTLQGNAGQLSVNDTADAFARAQLTGDPATADSDVTFSYQFNSATAEEYANAYLRGSGGFQNAFRPRNGYGVELQSNSATVLLRRDVNGTATTLSTVAAGQTVSTGKHWLRLRVSGSTIQFKIWDDGQSEPAGWTATVTDTSVTAAGQLHVSTVRGTNNSGAKTWTLDDLTLSNAN